MEIIIVKLGQKYSYVPLDGIQETVWDNKEQMLTEIKKAYGARVKITDRSKITHKADRKP